MKLVRSRLGLELPDDAPLAKLRSITLRYVLAGEFRSDLSCAPPAALDAVPAPKTKDEEAAVRRARPAASHQLRRGVSGDGRSRGGGTRASRRRSAGRVLSARSTRSGSRSARCWRIAATSSRARSSTRPSRSSVGGSTASGLTATSDGRPSGRPAAAWRSWERLAWPCEQRSARPAAMPTPGSTPTRPRTAGSGWTRRNGGSRRGSRTSTTSRRSARSASFDAPTRTPATRWPTASRRRW